MAALTATLAELHRRYDGPIEDRIRQAVLNGQSQSAGRILSSASRDLDRLALSTVLARARRRASAPDRPGVRLAGDASESALAAALLWYRGLGVRTIDARNAVGRHDHPTSDD
jgi:hypothetical protein